jgi:hypothetical protein
VDVITRIALTDLRFTPASRELRRTGMLGWAKCRLDGRWQLDGVAVRRTADGEYKLSFPSRTDGNGTEHAYFRPLDNGTRDEIEARVIAYVRAGGWLS